ncbi:MAG: hypothetical protein GWN13_01805, partial [Phycisphaerae bacterium]|nr:hypothetical protein [Phycisphaerae bacterium]
KETDGQVVGIYYDPNVSTGKLFTWPQTDDVSDYLVLWVKRPIEDMDAGTNDFDLPQEWLETVAYCLAARIRPKFKVPLQSVQDVMTRAEMLEDELMGWSEEDASVYFGPSKY